MRRSTVLAVALAIVAGLFAAAPASADHPSSAVTPTVVAGNPDCNDVEGLEHELQVKIPESGSPPTSGDHPFSNSISGVITLDVDADDILFDFEIDGAVALVVLVKGGPNANLYDYRPDGTASDVDLHAPDTPGGAPAELSHVTFCLGPAGPPPPPPPPPPPDGDDDDDDDDVEPAPPVRVEPRVTG